MEPVEIDEDVTAFLVESAENLSQIEQEIVSLETTDRPQEILIRIYRSLHTIKGNCGFLPFSKLEAVAHAGETLLSELRECPSAITTPILNGLLQTIDAIRQLLVHIETTGSEGDGDYSALIQHLTQLHAANFPPDTVLLNATLLGAATLDAANSSSLLPVPAEIAAEDAIASLSAYAASTYAATESPTLSAIDASVRVNLNLLDQVMDLVGELVLTRNQVLQYSTAHASKGLSHACQRLDQITAALQTSVMKTRMQPLGALWQFVPRLVRDLALDHGKQIQVVMEGAETELDKRILEAIKDPLTQLVRNCVDHGIESPDVRLARGKPAVGQLSLRAFHANGKVNLEIGDDGNGIDLERLKQRAQQLGIRSPAQLAALSDADALDLMFLPGFSTAAHITKLSGRGVGMDIVRSNLEKLNGSIEVHSQVGQGTLFRLKLPLTLAIISALIVTSGGERFAIPQSSIQELVRFSQPTLDRIATLYDVPVYRLRDTLLPLLYLNQELQCSDPAEENELVSIVVVQAEDYQYGLVVDAIQDTQEIVVRPLSNQLAALSMFAGATILGDGTVALILDAIGLADHAKLAQHSLAPLNNGSDGAEGDRSLIVLIHGTAGARMGIPLDRALRLEQFAPSAVETVGNQDVVPYGNQVLPLIDLYPLFSQQRRRLAEVTSDRLQVVVVSLPNAQPVGLVVETVLDIVEDSLAVQGAASRAGVACIAMVHGEATEILDLEALIQMANPYLLRAS